MAPTIQTPADLTDIEIACGVTTDQVIAEAARSLVIDNGEKVVVETHHGPAVSGAAARRKLGGPVEFAGLNLLGHAVYRKSVF